MLPRHVEKTSCPADGVAAAGHFLESWFHDLEGLAELRYFPPNEAARQEFFPPTHLPGMAARAGELSAAGASVHFGCATRRKVRGQPRGGNAAVLWIPGFWVDLDFDRFEAGGIEALERLDAFWPAPTALVHTGHGFHAYWRMREPLYPTARTRAMFRAVVRELGADPGAIALSHVLRVPGTWSPKRNAPVRLLRCSHV